MIFPVSVVLGRTIVDSDWCFENLCGSHVHTQRYYHCRCHHHHHHHHSSCQHKGITLPVQPTLSFMDGLFYFLRVSLSVPMQSIKRWKLFQRRQTANNKLSMLLEIHVSVCHNCSSLGYLLEILVYCRALWSSREKPIKFQGWKGVGDPREVEYCISSNNWLPMINSHRAANNGRSTDKCPAWSRTWLVKFRSCRSFWPVIFGYKHFIFHVQLLLNAL